MIGIFLDSFFPLVGDPSLTDCNFNDKNSNLFKSLHAASDILSIQSCNDLPLCLNVLVEAPRLSSRRSPQLMPLVIKAPHWPAEEVHVKARGHSCDLLCTV